MLISGTTENANNTYAMSTRSLIVGEITLTAATVLDQRDSIQVAASSGLSSSYSSRAGVSVYSELLFEKIG